MTPPRLGRYRLGRRLAVGGMAEVFAATVEGAKGFEKEVAVKRILPHLGDDPEFVQMFEDEARLASKLAHANIAQVFDFGEEDGVLFLVMEWIHGKDLRRVTRAAAEAGTRFTPMRTVHVGREVARALAYAHGLRDGAGEPLGLVHRDVSPQNVLVSFNGEVKLTDFGIAKAAAHSGHTAQGVIKGKCAYMSPEQARGEPLDGRTDVFALGVVLWELLSGRRLFQGGSDMEILRAVKHLDVPRPSSVRPEVPADLDEVILGCLEKDRAQRLPSAAELEAALGDVLLKHAASTRELDLSGLMRALFPDEADGRLRGTARLPASPGGSPPSPNAPPPTGTTPPPPDDGPGTLADRPSDRPLSQASPAAAPRVEATAALPDASPTPARRWPLWFAGAVALSAAIVAVGMWRPGAKPAAVAPKPASRPPVASITADEAPAPKPADDAPKAKTPGPDANPVIVARPASHPRRAHARAHPHRRLATTPAHRAEAVHRVASPAPPAPEAAGRTGGTEVLARPGAGTGAAHGSTPAHVRLLAGTRLDARLSAGIDTAAGHTVVAELTRSIIRGNRVLLPRGTQLTGRARASGERIVVHFTRVSVPGASSHALSATAYGADGRPGLAVPDALIEGGGAALSLPRGTRLGAVLDDDLVL